MLASSSPVTALDAHVYEQASFLHEVGAGAAIRPNAVRVLHRLGLADALGAVGVVPLSMDPQDGHSGALLHAFPLQTPPCAAGERALLALAAGEPGPCCAGYP